MNYSCGESWEALGPQRPGQLSIVTKIALLGEGRYFLWLCFPLSPARPSGEKPQEPTACRIGTWLVGARRGDSPVTKGGNEYAVSVIILRTSQSVFQYVISIVKLPKQETNDTNSSQRVGGEKRGQEVPPPPIRKLPSVRNSFTADGLFTRQMDSRS